MRYARSEGTQYTQEGDYLGIGYRNGFRGAFEVVTAIRRKRGEVVPLRKREEG